VWRRLAVVVSSLSSIVLRRVEDGLLLLTDGAAAFRQPAARNSAASKGVWPVSNRRAGRPAVDVRPRINIKPLIEPVRAHVGGVQ